MKKLNFKRCKGCNKWTTNLTCPECKEAIPCGDLVDKFSAEYAIGGNWEDEIYSEEIECTCGFVCFVGEWEKTQTLENDPVYSMRVSFDLESKYDE